MVEYATPILAVCDGGAEVALLSQWVYQQLDPKPVLHPTTEKIKGLYGPSHGSSCECLIKAEMPELSVAVNYVLIVDDIEEDLLINASMLHYAPDPVGV